MLVMDLIFLLEHLDLHEAFDFVDGFDLFLNRDVFSGLLGNFFHRSCVSIPNHLLGFFGLLLSNLSLRSKTLCYKSS